MAGQFPSAADAASTAPDGDGDQLVRHTTRSGPPGPGGRPSAVRVATWAAVVLVVAASVRRTLAEPLAAVEPTRANAVLNRGQDFRDATYFPIKELLRGGIPYDPDSMFAHWPVRQEFDLYAPFHLLLQLPFTLLPYRPALIAFSLASIGYLLAAGVVGARVLRLPGGWPAAWVVGALVVAAQFGKAAVFFGQIDPLVGLGTVLALLFAGRSVGWSALGLALAWTKPQFAIPITVLLLARGTWRPALWGTLGAGLASLPVVGVLVVRAGGIGGFLDVVSRNLEYASTQKVTAVDAVTGARVDGAAVVFRLTGVLPPGMQAIVFVVVLGVAAWLLSRPGRRGRALDVPELALAAIAVCVGIVKQQGESIGTVPALVGVVVLLLAGRRPAWTVLAAWLLLWVPVLHVSAVEHLLTTAFSPAVDALVEGVSLNVAFWLVVAHLVRHRREPAEPLPLAAAGSPAW